MKINDELTFIQNYLKRFMKVDRNIQSIGWRSPIETKYYYDIPVVIGDGIFRIELYDGFGNPIWNSKFYTRRDGTSIKPYIYHAFRSFCKEYNVNWRELWK